MHGQPDSRTPLVGQEFKVLDDGFIRVIDLMGDDSAIVQAARISYGAGTKSVSQDRGLIRYLMRHLHTTPFEMCEIKLHIRIPMDAWRQWIRHRTANVNEYSTRYSLAIDSTYKTAPDAWRTQSSTNKQGSEEPLPVEIGRELSAEEERLHEEAKAIYNARIAKGVSREQARKDLPLCTYTEAYWKIDLHNLLHFINLRIAPNAQWEIRQYAEVLGHKIAAQWVPLAWEAFVDYRMNATSLSRLEAALVRHFALGETAAALDFMQNNGFLQEKDGAKKLTREGREIGDKLELLGFAQHWHRLLAEAGAES